MVVGLRQERFLPPTPTPGDICPNLEVFLLLCLENLEQEWYLISSGVKDSLIHSKELLGPNEN